MPWAFWKRQAFSVRAAKKSWESPGSEAAWATQKELPGSATTKRHWRPVGVRCWHRSGVKSELGDFCVILILDEGWGDPTPPGVLGKSAQSIENKGREVGKERQESSRVRKRLEVKEIGEVEEVKEFKKGALLGWGAGETMAKRVFTRYDRTDYRSCQYLNCVPVFRDWAQSRNRKGREIS